MKIRSRCDRCGTVQAEKLIGKDCPNLWEHQACAGTMRRFEIPEHIGLHCRRLLAQDATGRRDMADEPKLSVEISASQIVHYKQTVQMTRKEWERMSDQDGEEALDANSSEASGWLDLRDVHDGGDFESIRAVVVDDRGKPVEGETELEIG